MFAKIAIVACVASVALAQDYPKPAYPAPAQYKQPSYEPGMPYNFQWGVKDDPSYNNYAQEENSDGKLTSGFYRVALPDGRTQIVSYKADDYTGFVADVKYEGEAKYPEYKAGSYPAPAYGRQAAYPPKYPS